MSVNLTHAAKELRKNATDAERLLWHRLQARQLEGLKFRRQEQIGRFIVDFVCYETQLIVEADGGQHALEREKDEERTRWLNAQGFTVLRFWNHEILTNIDGVLEAIRRRCLPSPLPPAPSHQGEGEQLPGCTEGWVVSPPSLGGGAKPAAHRLRLPSSLARRRNSLAERRFTLPPLSGGGSQIRAAQG